MIIINQDKTEIINFDNTFNICLYPDLDDSDNECGYKIYAGMKAPDDNYRTLGYYKTKGRAKEVLGDMGNWIMSADKLNRMGSVDEMQTYAMVGQYRIYEMPKE